MRLVTGRFLPEQGKPRLGPSCVVGFESGCGATSKAIGHRRSPPISRWLLYMIGSMPGRLTGRPVGFSVKGTRTSQPCGWLPARIGVAFDPAGCVRGTASRLYSVSNQKEKSCSVYFS